MLYRSRGNLSMHNLTPSIFYLDFGFLKIKKVHTCIIILISIIFKSQIRFMLHGHKKKNYFICLGTNCFPHKMLSRIGIKPRKKEGELSCPFDLCITSVHSIAQILENNFSDYLENIVYNTQNPQNNKSLRYRNIKYDINYIHDGCLKNIEELKLRYKKRIENFINLSANQKEIAYLLCVFNNEFTTDDINSIYNSLKKYRKNKPFKFAVFSFSDNYTNTKAKLNSEIIYKEYIPQCGSYAYQQNWFRGALTYNEQTFLAFYKDVCQL